MKRFLIVLITFLITVTATILITVTAAQNRPYMLVMFDCSTHRNMFGDNVTWHTSEADAIALGDSRLADYDIAYIYRPLSQTEFVHLLWVKTDTNCYAGNYRDWTQPQ